MTDNVEVNLTGNYASKALEMAKAAVKWSDTEDRLIKVLKTKNDVGTVTGEKFTILRNGIQQLTVAMERNFAANKKDAKQWEITKQTVTNTAAAIEKLSRAQIQAERTTRRLAEAQARALRASTLQQMRGQSVGGTGIDYGPRPLTGAAYASAYKMNAAFDAAPGKAMDAYYTKLGEQYMLADKRAAQATKRVQQFGITWQGVVRMVQAQVIYRAMYEITAQISQAVQTAGELERKIGLIRTISQEAQLTTTEWAQGIVKISNMFGSDVLDTAGATYEAISNQVAKGQDAIRFMESVGKLSMTTGSTQMEAMEALSGVINAYGKNIADAEEISAQFFKTVDLGRVQLGQIANSIGQVVGPASLLGVRFEEVASALSLLTIRGISPSMALTQLRQIMFALIKPSKEMKEQLRDFGVESGQALIQTYGFAEAMGKLEEAAKDDASELGQLFKNIRALVPSLIFAGKGMDEYRKILDETKNSAQTYNDATAIMLDNTGTQSKIATNRLKNALLEVGQGLQEFYVMVAKYYGLVNTKHDAFLAEHDAIVANINSNYKKISDSLQGYVDQESRLYLQAKSEFLRTINEQVKSHKEAYEEMFENFKNVNDRTMDGLKDQLTAYRAVEREAVSTAKKARQNIKDIFREKESLFFDMDLDNADIPGKVKLYKQQIAHLLQTSQIATDQGDFDSLKRDRKAITDIYKELYKLQKDNEKVLSDSKRKQAELQDDYNHRRVQLERDLSHAQRAKKPDIDRIRDLQENLAKLDKEYAASLAKITTSIEKASTDELRRLNIRELINKSYEEEARLSEELAKKQDEKAKQAQKDQVRQSVLIDEFKDYKKEFEKFKIEKVDEAKTEEELNKLLKNREDNFQKIKAVQDKLGISNEDIAVRGQFTAEEALRINQAKERISLESSEKAATSLKDLAAAGIQKLTDESKKRVLAEEEIRVKLQEAYDNALAVVDKLYGWPFKGKKRSDIEAQYKYLDQAVQGNLSPENIAEIRRQIRNMTLALTQEAVVAQKDTVDPGSSAAVTYAETAQAALARVSAILGTITNAPTQVELEKLTAKYKEEVAARHELAKTEAEIERGKFNATVNAIKTTQDLTNVLNKFSEANRKAISGITTPAKEQFATGGQVGTDTVHAMLTPGEFVMNAHASRRFYTQLLAMNNNGVRHMSNGGPVTNIGDLNVTVQSSGNSTVDAAKIGKALQRAIRQRRITL